MKSIDKERTTKFEEGWNHIAKKMAKSWQAPNPKLIITVLGTQLGSGHLKNLETKIKDGIRKIAKPHGAWIISDGNLHGPS